MRCVMLWMQPAWSDPQKQLPGGCGSSPASPAWGPFGCWFCPGFGGSARPDPNPRRVPRRGLRSAPRAGGDREEANRKPRRVRQPIGALATPAANEKRRYLRDKSHLRAPRSSFVLGTFVKILELHFFFLSAVFPEQAGFRQGGDSGSGASGPF